MSTFAQGPVQEWGKKQVRSELDTSQGEIRSPARSWEDTGVLESEQRCPSALCFLHLWTQHDVPQLCRPVGLIWPAASSVMDSIYVIGLMQLQNGQREIYVHFLCLVLHMDWGGGGGGKATQASSGMN